jgi:hypothetical protein
MRIPHKAPITDPAGELAELMNFNLSGYAAERLRPELHGKAVFIVQSRLHEERRKSGITSSPEYDYKILLDEQLEHGKTSRPVSSALEFLRAFGKLSCFRQWSSGGIIIEQFAASQACEVYTVQQALNFILRPLVTAKTPDEVKVGVDRVLEFINRESWFVCPSSFREYQDFLYREHGAVVGPVEETFPLMWWRMERKVGPDGKFAGFEINLFTNGHELYPVAMMVLAEIAKNGSLMNLKRCALEECLRFFGQTKHPGTRATFCSKRCRAKHNNEPRVSEERRKTKYNEMLYLAKLKVPLTEDQRCKVETFMGVEEFEKFKAAVRKGITRPKVSDEVRARFAAPRPRQPARR